MCSINGCTLNDSDDEICKNKEKDSLVRDTTLCRKDKCQNVSVLLVGRNSYCMTCFLNDTNHKFRAALGKSKIIRHGDLILVDHTGELNSTVLLHLIKAGMSESTHKKLIFKTIVLYIDGCTVEEKTSEEKDMLRQKIAEEMKASGFDGYAVSMSEVLNEEDALDIRPMEQEINNKNYNRLRAILTNLSDDTSKTDFLNQLHRRLLLLAARKLNCNKIFVADTALDIATRVLGDVCLGRGAKLSTQANFCDARCTDIKILKPMREFTQQELMYYSEYHKINFVESVVPNKPTSIQALARNFTMNQEHQFSNTVSTIFRTADKISPRSDVQRNAEDNCALCDTRLDFMPSGSEVTAMRAIEVSKLVSSKCVNARLLSTEQNGEPNYLALCSDNSELCNDNTECSCKNDKKGQITRKDILKHLCYSCGLIFKKSDILDTLPSSLLSAIERRLALENMRDKISDFLL